MILKYVETKSEKNKGVERRCLWKMAMAEQGEELEDSS